MKKVILIIILTFISALLIFYRFVDIPKYLAFDEVEFAKLALSLQNKSYIPFSPLATGHSTMYFYILLMSLKLFGITTFALRLPAAIFGVLSVTTFYLIMRIVFQQYNNIAIKRYFPFLLALIFASSRWFLNFSRFSFEATFLLFLELISIYFLISFWQAKRNQNIFLLFSGVFTGLAFLSYTPGRIFFILPVGFLLFRKQFNNETMKQLFIFLIPFLITITPLTTYLITNKDNRIDQQFFLMNHEMPINQKISGLLNNIFSTALMFDFKGDMNGRHNYPGKPALNPILGILFIIGFIISLKNYKNHYLLFFIIYYFLSILPALMTYPWENPNMLRTFTVIPSVIYFIGLGLMSFPRRRKSILIIITLILLSSFYELRTYFKYQSTVFNQSFEIKLPLEKAIKVKLKP